MSAPEKTPAPEPAPPPGGVGVHVSPMLIPVPVLTEADLEELDKRIDESNAAHARLRATARRLRRQIQAAMNQWSLPKTGNNEETKPSLRLVPKSSDKHK